MLTAANLEAHDFRLDYAKELLAAMEHRRGKAALVEENNELRAKVAELTNLKELRERMSLRQNLIRVEENNAFQAKIDELIKENNKLQASHAKLASWVSLDSYRLRQLDLSIGRQGKEACPSEVWRDNFNLQNYARETLKLAEEFLSKFHVRQARQESEQKRQRVSQ